MINRSQRQLKKAYYLLEGLGSLAVAFYFYYVYFLLKKQYGFDSVHCLGFAALNGIFYLTGSLRAGWFAQHRGYFNALKVGFVLMIAALSLGFLWHSLTGIILATLTLSVGMCFLWPTIEALVSEGQDAVGLPRAVGTYNVVWAGTNAVALFGGGMLVEHFGFKTIFILPLIIVIGELAMTLRLEKLAARLTSETGNKAEPQRSNDPHRPSPNRARAFLRMAWLANPFAYLAINTLIPMLPTLADRFQLSPMFAGFACSLWCFVRLATFALLWHWTGWHYRFRWLVAAFGTLLVAFVSILTVPSFAVLILAQLFFGVAIGLIYYSSLFYSMDVSETKGVHGGIHEAAIGLGNCIGPAVGAASLQFLPQHANSGAIAVSVLLLCGLGGLLTIWKTAR